MSSMFCTKIYSCKNANWCARDFNPKSAEPKCFEQLTNYDRIISESPEELAKEIVRLAFHVIRLKEPVDGILDYLRREAET